MPTINPLTDLSQPPSVAYIPSPTTLFRDAAAANACGDGQLIYTFKDSGPNARHLTQNSRGRRLYARLQNGVWWCTKNGAGTGSAASDAYGKGLKTASTFTAVPQPLHIFAVVRQYGWAGSRRIWETAAANTMGILQRTATPTVRIYTGSDGPLTTDLTLGTSAVVKVLWNGSGSKIGINSGAYSATGAGGSASMTRVYYGFSAGNGDGAQVDMGPFFAFSFELTTQEETDLLAYLAPWVGQTTPTASDAYPDVPAQVYTDLADVSKTTVTVPAGTYWANTPLAITRPLTLDGNGATIYYVEEQLSVVNAVSDYDSGGAHGLEYHLTGTITAATTSLTIDPAEPCPVVAGERVILRPGVDTIDPNESVCYHWCTVQSVVGDTITFTEPVGLDIPVYASEAELQALAGSQSTKVGAWNTTTAATTLGRGLGQDHGLIRFNTPPIDGVTLRNLTLVSDLAEAYTDGANTIACQFVENLTVTDLAVTNPAKSCLFLTAVNRATVSQVRASGRGRSLVFSGTQDGPGFLISCNGGTDHTYTDLTATGEDIVLMNAEAGLRNATFDRFYVNTATNEIIDFKPQHFSAVSGSVGVLFENGAVNVDSDYGPFNAFNPDYEISNVRFLGASNGYYLHRLFDTSPTYLDAPSWYDLPVEDWETITYQIGSGQANPVVLPTRLYKSLRVRAVSGPAITQVSATGTSNWSGSGGWWSAPDELLQPPPTKAAYLNMLSLTVHTATGTVADCVLEFETMRGPPAFAGGDIGFTARAQQTIRFTAAATRVVSFHARRKVV